MKILVTAGGTKEYIDGVRYIGNSSSGKTGAQLLDYLVERGHDVTWLGAKTAIRPQQPAQILAYETFDELALNLQKLLSEHHFDVVFHAAAVSDFKVSAVILDGEHFAAGRGVKLPNADQVQLQLTKQPKLVASIKSWSLNSDITVVAFKLTNSTDFSVRQAAITQLIQQPAVNLVAHNDLNEITDSSHVFDLYTEPEQFSSCTDVKALADTVIQHLGEIK